MSFSDKKGKITILLNNLELTTHIMKRSSYKEYREDALASGADEGRDKLR